MSLSINELVKLNVSINYSDVENKLSGSIILDGEDWGRILSAIDLAGYELVKRKGRELHIALSDNINLNDSQEV